MPSSKTGYIRSGIATVCLSGTLEDKLAAASTAGFDGVEIFENDLVASPWSPTQLRQRCADLGLSIDLYQPFRDFEAVPTDVLAANLRRAELKFNVMEQLGTDTILVCSSVSPDAVDDDGLAAEQLHTLASRAAERGLRIAYEALAWGKFVNTYDHSWRIVRDANHPALGLCLDSFHILSRGTDPSGIRDIPGEKLFFLQLADAPRLQMDVLQWSRHHRLFPGQGVFDLTSFVGHVLAAGYQGPLSLEVFNDVFRQSNPGPAAIDARRSLLALQETFGRQEVFDPLVPAQVRGRSLTSGLPPAPTLSGHAFTEIVLDEISYPEVAATLTSLGFTLTGQHRSKPVQLWEQGDARVLVNTVLHPTGARPTVLGRAAIGAIAVESADPHCSAERARKLLAPVLPRTHRADEASLDAVAAPDGTSVFFCRTDANDDSSWLSDFTPVGSVGIGAGLIATDHLSLTQPFDHYDEASLFYRAVLGLQPNDVTEFAAPFGLMRSRAVTDQTHQVRIALDSALLRRGDWAPDVREPQHIAFTTTDAIASARMMRSLGAPLLEIPDNYYEDLDARLALDPKLLAAIREASVLYDRDKTGEYLHFCTHMLGGRIFFEVVQRIGGYTGYGHANVPVRMAAHWRLRNSQMGHERASTIPSERVSKKLTLPKMKVGQ